MKGIPVVCAIESNPNLNPPITWPAVPGLSTVTDTGLRALRACCGLRKLDVRNTSITDEGKGS